MAELIVSFLEPASRLVKLVLAVLTDYQQADQLDEPTASNRFITLAEVQDDIDASDDATNRVEQKGPDWNGLWDHITRLTAKQLYPLAMGVVAAVLVVFAIKAVALDRERPSVPVVVGVIIAPMLYASGVAMHRPRTPRQLGTARVTLLTVAVVLSVGGGFVELVDPATSTSGLGRLALLIPIGMVYQGFVISCVIRHGTNGRHRRASSVGWFMLAVGAAVSQAAQHHPVGALMLGAFLFAAGVFSLK